MQFDNRGRATSTAQVTSTHRFWRDCARAVVGFLAVVLLAGCSMLAPKLVPFPASSDLVGQWNSSDGGSLKLNSSGKFTMKDVPRGVVEHDPLSAITSRRGWALAEQEPGTLTVALRTRGSWMAPRSSICCSRSQTRMPTDSMYTWRKMTSHERYIFRMVTRIWTTNTSSTGGRHLDRGVGCMTDE
jgi:hypothetical protein